MSSDRMQFTRALAAEAGARALEHYDNLARLRVETKGVQDYVSEADRDVEALIRARIEATFPGEGFIGEETGRTDGRGHWVVDPIDGTSNFLRGIPMFGVSIAYAEDGAVRCAAIRDVAQHRTYWAERGGGAFLDDAPIRVSSRDQVTEAAVCLGFWTKGEHAHFVEAMQRVVQTRCDFRRFGAATIALALTAAGHMDGFWQARINSWDVAAGILLVEEAGGWVSPFIEDGGLDAPVPLLACTPALRAPLSKILGFPGRNP